MSSKTLYEFAFAGDALTAAAQEIAHAFSWKNAPF